MALRRSSPYCVWARRRAPPPLLRAAALAAAALTAVATLSAIVRRAAGRRDLFAVDRRDIDLEAVAQPVGAVGDDAIARLQAALDRGQADIIGRHVSRAGRDLPHRDGAVGIEHVDVAAERAAGGAGGAALYSGGGHGDGVLERLHQQLHVDELIGKQRVVGVVELRAHLDGAGGGVDLIVDRDDLADGKLFAV